MIRDRGTAKIKRNPEYEKRLTHHVGGIETYNPKKLGSFKIIVCNSGGTYYTKQPMETLRKVSGLLAPGGTAFLEIPRENPEIRKNI
jgi:hypothetical protein